MLVCALLIKVDSRGPVFFRQMRMGRHFIPFALLKLRTMQSQARGHIITLGADPRVTRVGHWLRSWKLDELPQLWNVLCGDMSIVGPRPVIPEIVRAHHGAYESLLTVRPGLTDPASLKYFNECRLLDTVADPLVYFEEVVTPDKLRLSSRHIETATLWSDLQIMAQTGIMVAQSMLEAGRELLRHSPAVEFSRRQHRMMTDGLLH